MNRSRGAHHYTKRAPLLKGAMRAVWRLLPRSKLSYNVGKMLTHTVLRPSSKPKPVITHFGGKMPMELDLGDFTANDLFCLDTHYESVTLDLWKTLAKTASVVLDVGGHLGTYSLVAADANPQARVIAVEADADNFSLLRRHCAPYPNIKPVHAAIAERHTTLWFHTDSTNAGGGYLSETNLGNLGCYQIETRSLTDVCRSEGVSKVDLVKIDVEGYEHALLVHDSEFWRIYKPNHLFVEIKRDTSYKATSEALFNVMHRRGYAARRVQGLYALPFGRADDLANWYFWRR